MKNSTAHLDHDNARFFGLDVHQKTITIALATRLGEPRHLATIDNRPSVVKRFFEKHTKTGGPIYVVYEAGGCGFHLARQLEAMGIIVIVAAPSKIKKASGEVKNDKRDAAKLAKLLRSHILMGHKELHPVAVPEQDDEAIREKSRQRNALLKKVRTTQNQISAMVRRHGLRYDLTKTLWTKTHRAWLERVDFGNLDLNEVFREYLDHLAEEEARLAKCERQLEAMCASWNRAEVVKALCALKGVGALTASSLVAEIGSFARFASATELMSYLGLTPSEHSSGEKVTRGRITKAGNKRARTLLIEAACSVRHKPKSKQAFMQSCPTGLPREVIEHAYKAQVRLYKRYWQLINKGKNTNAARTAVARELAGFVWGIALIAETVLDARDSVAA